MYLINTQLQYMHILHCITGSLSEQYLQLRSLLVHSPNQECGAERSTLLDETNLLVSSVVDSTC